MKINDFNYKSNYQSLNINNNFALQNKSKLDVHAKKIFYEKGFLYYQFQNLSNSALVQEFYDSTNLLGSYPAVDANRRKRFKFDNVNSEILASVDLGSSSINPHSEASFSPIRPAIIAFLCLDISHKASNSGLTTLIDGEAVWNDLEISTKKILQKLRIKYFLEIDIDIKQNPNGSNISSYLDYVNVSDVYLDTKKAKLKFVYDASFVKEHPVTRKISLANHAFVPLEQELQIIKKEFYIHQKPFELIDPVLSDIFNNIHKYTYTHKWNKDSYLIIDNYRFMHGRLGYDPSQVRKIIIRQLKNFKV